MKNKYFASGLLLAIALTVVSCNQDKVVKAPDRTIIDSLNARLKPLEENHKRMSENKRIVADFYQELFGDKNIDAIDKYIGDTYIQHNPLLPDGKEALKNAAKEWFDGAPKEKIDIHHLGADGDLVYIHTKANLGNKPFSVIDIFRLDNGRIVEHWDVIQEVPEKSANPHPMF